MSATQDQQLSRGALVALVVGSMVGSGIFTLPSAFGRATGVLGALIAWCIAGAGMLMLAFVFQTLSRRRPDLDAGIYAYAKAGFGNYLGFVSAFGYWIACCLADVACLILIKATLGQFFPVFGDGTTAVAILTASVMVWGVHMPRAARGPRGGGTQHDRHRRQDGADRHLHRGRHRGLPGRRLRAEFLGRRRAQPVERGEPGAQHDARHRVRVRRHRGSQRLFALREGPQRRGVPPPSSVSSACCACWSWSRCSRTASCCARILRRSRIHRWPASWKRSSGTGDGSSSASAC